MNKDGLDFFVGSEITIAGDVWGGTRPKFPNFPHVQNRYGMTTKQALQYYWSGGLNEVWRYCNDAM